MISGKCSKQLSSFHMLYGTAWKKEHTTQLVLQAFESGFRGVDTACQPKHYQEDLVGKALYQSFSSGQIKREDVWIQTKFTSIDGQDQKRIPYDKSKPLPDQVRESIEVSRKNLKIDVIDSLVLHSPMRGGFDDTLEVWKAMEQGIDGGKIQMLGISNCYDLEFFKRLYSEVQHKPKVLQNRFYGKTNWDNELRAFCVQNEIVYQSFWTLTANPELLGNKLVKTIASENKLTGEQVLFKFLVDLGHQPLTGCTSLNHVQEAVSIKDIPRLSNVSLNGIKKLIGDKHPL